MKRETERITPVKSLEELETMCEGDETLKKLYESMREFLFRYTETVLDFNEILMKGLGEEANNLAFQEIDAVRTRVHNGMIDSVNIFSRALGKAGKDNSWVGTFNGARSAYGRFALAATCQAIKKHEQELVVVTKEAA